MSPSHKGKKTKKDSAVSLAQREKIRQQLTEVLKEVQSGNGQRVSTTIPSLLKKYPALPEVNHVASVFYAQSRLFDQAVYYAERAIKGDPQIAEYQSTLGTILVQGGKYELAVEPLKKSIHLNNKSQQAYSALGVAYQQTGKIELAKETLNHSIVHFPNNHEAVMNLALLESDIANAHRAVELMQSSMDKFADNPIMHDSLAMFASYDDQLSPEQVFDIHQAFGKCVQRRVGLPKGYSNIADPNKRIRIGFISPDFQTHSIAYFVEPIFKHLDRSQFELYLYSTSSYRDDVTARFEEYADIFRVMPNGIAQTHKQVVQDRLDIFVELTGHFASNQLPLFAAKPAPVSISAIGYGNTTGLESIDARIVDEVTDPTPDADNLATEQLVRVEGCFLCYQPPENAPEICEPEQDRSFTFGSFNDLRKMSPSTFSAWAKILIANPTSRLVLKSSRLAESEVQHDILKRFEALSVDPARISLWGRTPTNREHLDLYNQVDCSLDTFPYTGTTTTCESLWMGVPMITLLGNAHAGRVSASLLETAGCNEFIANTVEEYIEIATKLVSNGVRTSSDRLNIREAVSNSSLIDQQAYTHKIERVYRQLWQSWCDRQGGN
ncbi:MAG: tetratricopeptide repeat protein [Phycisphaerales bacterium]|nr:tetratricopeptide repeat protein [Phycisphaerales bacterium]